jgi:hypothetical protein
MTDDLAVAPSLPAIHGPGGCGADDLVQLEAVVLPNRSRIAVTPPAILRCSLAEAIVQWVRKDLTPLVGSLGGSLKSIDNYASYDCRGRNRVQGALLSEHGKANALDIRSLKLANGRVVALTDVQLSRDFRDSLRKATCARFMTVLGPGSDGFHEDHMLISRNAEAVIECASGMYLSPMRLSQPVSRPCRSRDRVPEAPRFPPHRLRPSRTPLPRAAVSGRMGTRSSNR